MCSYGERVKSLTLEVFQQSGEKWSTASKTLLPSPKRQSQKEKIARTRQKIQLNCHHFTTSLPSPQSPTLPPRLFHPVAPCKGDYLNFSGWIILEISKRLKNVAIYQTMQV